MLSIRDVIEKKVDFGDFAKGYEMMHDLTYSRVAHENVQRLLMDPSETYDAVIVEWMYSDLYSGLAAVFNCPYIWSSSMDPHTMVLRLIDEIPNPAYITNLSPRYPPLSFVERVKEFMDVLYLYRIRWAMTDMENKAWTELYGPALAARGRQLPAFDEVRFNASLMFGNSHVSAGLANQLPQNYVPIAGYHINNVEPLPDNLQKIMDNSHNGVIYFSLGTMMKASTIPDEITRGILKTFSTLKQTVIWKFEQSITDLPKNVHIVKWAPQQSILAHKNIVLFITHGGLLSTTEAIHFGVPIIGIPLFADQFMNIKRAVGKGFAKHVEIGYDVDVKLKETIDEILVDPKYHQRVKELSFIYHHRPVTPGSQIVHWVEHVIRTSGKHHLRSPGFLVPWYQKLFLDLLALVVFAFVALVLVLMKVWSIFRASKKLKQS